MEYHSVSQRCLFSSSGHLDLPSIPEVNSPRLPSSLNGVSVPPTLLNFTTPRPHAKDHGDRRYPHPSTNSGNAKNTYLTQL
ncbi:hypothetical protein N7454_004579 [Penicillium verhagenii]|nr:hypothetical protein N7454_004579 [Penicillium verhagenii]